VRFLGALSVGEMFGNETNPGTNSISSGTKFVPLRFILIFRTPDNPFEYNRICGSREDDETRGGWQISSVSVVLSKFFLNSEDLDPT